MADDVDLSHKRIYHAINLYLVDSRHFNGFRYRFLTLGTPWTQSMPSRDVNAVTRLAEASWWRDKYQYKPDLNNLMLI